MDQVGQGQGQELDNMIKPNSSPSSVQEEFLFISLDSHKTKMSLVKYLNHGQDPNTMGKFGESESHPKS